jgi:hypothetical protein
MSFQLGSLLMGAIESVAHFFVKLAQSIVDAEILTISILSRSANSYEKSFDIDRHVLVLFAARRLQFDTY